MIRLVFRPYTQIWRWICTSQTLRSSIRFSSDFNLFRHSSPSFGSQHLRSYSNLFTVSYVTTNTHYKIGRGCKRGKVICLCMISKFISTTHNHTTYPLLSPLFTFITRCIFYTLYNTRVHARLLGPCFKTGSLNFFYT